MFAMRDENREAGITGTCMTMCSAEERRFRESNNLLHPLEMLDTGDRRHLPRADPQRTVKCYVRPAAGQASSLAHELRPAPVLRVTVEYLLGSLLDLDQDFDQRQWITLYDFVFDRLRAVRQDMVIQQLGPADSISLLGPIVRFYAYAAYRLCEEPVTKFDPSINRTHLLECLKMLLLCFDAKSKDEGSSPRPDVGLAVMPASDKVLSKPVTRASMKSKNTPVAKDNAEQANKQTHVLYLSQQPKENMPEQQEVFEALYVVLNLGDPDALRRALYQHLQYRCVLLDKSLCISLAFCAENYVRVLRKLTTLPPLVAAVAALHIPTVRRSALQALNSGLSCRTQAVPPSVLRQMLLYACDEDVVAECVHYGIRADSAVHFQKGSFNRNTPLLRPKQVSWVDTRLASCSIPKLLIGTGRCMSEET